MKNLCKIDLSKWEGIPEGSFSIASPSGATIHISRLQVRFLPSDYKVIIDKCTNRELSDIVRTLQLTKQEMQTLLMISKL